MKIKEIVKLCKKSSIAFLYNDADGQVLSDGKGAYRLEGCPKFDIDTLCSTFDFNEKQKRKLVKGEYDGLPEQLEFEDCTELEYPCEEYPMGILVSDASIVPYKTEEGVVFVDSQYLAPLSDFPKENIVLYARKSEKYGLYFAVKVGLMIKAIITPYKCITPEFNELLKNLSKFVDVSLFNQAQEDEKDE